MWRYLAFILDFPITLAGIALAFASIPTSMRFDLNHLAFVFKVKSFWWALGANSFARGTALGHVVCLGPREQHHDLEHELVHVEQCIRAPFLHPFLYRYELLRKGYQNNKFEIEAYTKSDSVWTGGFWKGMIVKESLTDAAMLEKVSVTNVSETDDIDPVRRWHLYKVDHVTRSQMDDLSRVIKSRGWYAHFWREGNMVVIYKDKFFAFTGTNKHGRQLAIEYGISVGIPKEQLDFKIS